MPAASSRPTTRLMDRNSGGLTPRPALTIQVAEAMRTLYENPEMRQRLGRNARERVKKHFVHSVTIPKIEAIYQSLVA